MNRYVQIERALSKFKARPMPMNVNPIDFTFKAAVEWADHHPIRYEEIPVAGEKSIAEELKIFERLIACKGFFYNYFGNDVKTISRNAIENNPLDCGTSFNKHYKNIS